MANDQDSSDSVPVIPILESVMLDVPVDSSSVPSTSLDPIQSDVIYIQHSSGVDAICIEPWLKDVTNVLAGQGELSDLAGSEVARLVETSG